MMSVDTLQYAIDCARHDARDVARVMACVWCGFDAWTAETDEAWDWRIFVKCRACGCRLPLAFLLWPWQEIAEAFDA